MEETLTPIGIGVRLRTARESMRLSEKEAAARLNLNSRLIDIMETESFHQGPPATFMRGYIRSYGRLLNFNDHEINLAIEQLNLLAQPTIPQPSPLQKKEQSLQLDRYLRLSSYFVISLLLGLVIVWWASHPRFNEAEMMTKQVADATPIQPNPANTIAEASIATTPAAPVVSPMAPKNSPVKEPVLLAEKPTAPIPALNPQAPVAATQSPEETANPIHVANNNETSADDIDDEAGDNIY